MNDKPHLAPDGCTTEQHITQEVSHLLGHTRKCGGFAYHFEATLNKSLHKSALVSTYNTSITTRRHTGHAQGPRTGTCTQTPQNTHFMLPLHKKTVSVQWADTSTIEIVPYSTLQSPLIEAEEQLRVRILQRVSIQQKSTEVDINDTCEIRLRGGLLTVQCNVEKLTDDLHGIVQAFCKHITNIQTFQEETSNTISNFYNTYTPPTACAGVHTSKLLHEPINRKQFTQKVKHDPGLQMCQSDNIAKHNNESFCSRLQPHDFQGHEVIVPHWTTTTTIVSYVRAQAVQHHVDTNSYTVKHLHTKKQWTVPLPHVHPCQSCQDVQTGSMVFWDTGDRPATATNSKSQHSIVLHRVSNVVSSNDLLVCGYAKSQPVNINLPTPFSITALNKKLTDAGLSSVRAELTTSHSLRFTSTLPRFTVWAASTCVEICGFDTGCTYESTPKPNTKEHILSAPHTSSLHLKGVIRTRVQLELTLVSPGKPVVAHIVDIEQCVPLRHTYAKDGATFAHRSSYQTFPLRYLTRERPQRGLLLYHEMGSGKSRTSIEMAQCDVEQRYWKPLPTQKQLAFDKPSVVLMSPTQEARDHFIEECALWLASRWTIAPTQDKNTSKTKWIPAQHHYSSFHTEALQQEIRAHQHRVLSFLKDRVFLFIVYTNNTNNLFRMINVFRQGCAQRTFTSENQTELKQFFHRRYDDADFQWNAHRLHADEMYSRLFSDTFVIIDEIHNLCNAIASATDKKLPEMTSGCGTFFYRALMEAVDCQVVGLTGTPMQRTALSIAPLFNLLRGKQVVCNVVLTNLMSNEAREELFASFRPFAHTIWADCKQTNNKNFIFSPWPTRATLKALQLHIRSVHTQYKSTVQIEQKDTELFPFAFKYATRGKQMAKTYCYDNATFVEKYVKNNEICNISHFLLRIYGLVSYISPPKNSADSIENTISNKNDEYPKYNIHTTHLSAHPSHIAYIRSIQAKKKKINQSKADVEQRSGCNVNWNAVPQQLRDGKEGVLKLFFKGNNEQERHEANTEQSYHKLLHSVHSQFANPQSTNSISILPYLKVEQKLKLFSPKIHQIVSTLLTERHQKSVVYSDFIDGVGKFGADGLSQSQHRQSMDEKHVGLSGLGLLGYALNANDYVQLKVRVHHPLETLHTKVWKTLGNKRDVFLALGPTRCNSVDLITFEAIVNLCKDVRVQLSDEEIRHLKHDVQWQHITKRMRDLCRQCLMQEEFSHNFLMQHVQYRLSIAEHCRNQLFRGSTHFAPAVYAEYMDRTVHNKTSKIGRQFAKQTLLHLFNLRTNTQLIHMALTDQTRQDFETLLAHDKQRLMHNSQTRAADVASKAKAKAERLSTHHASSYKRRHTINVHKSRHSKPKKPTKPTQKHKKTKHTSKTKPTSRKGGKRISNNSNSNNSVGNVYGSIIQTLFVSTSVTEGVEFKDVRKMHILEPPADYRKLEQMFGRVIRRGSHAGLQHSSERSVNIYLYLLSSATSLEDVKQDAYGRQQSQSLTIDEYYWTRVIRNKYEISQEFYQLMKHCAVDCTHNLVLNTTSFQDRALTCFKYPYQRNLQDWVDSEAPMYSPLEDMELSSNTQSRAIDLHKIEKMAVLN